MCLVSVPGHEPGRSRGGGLAGEPAALSAPATPLGGGVLLLPKSGSESRRGNYRLVPRMEPPWPVQPPTSPQPISFIWGATNKWGVSCADGSRVCTLSRGAAPGACEALGSPPLPRPDTERVRTQDARGPALLPHTPRHADQIQTSAGQALPMGMQEKQRLFFFIDVKGNFFKN